MKTDAITKLLLAAVAGGLFWLGSILEPVAKQVPKAMEYAGNVNKTIESLTDAITNWRLFQQNEQDRNRRR